MRPNKLQAIKAEQLKADADNAPEQEAVEVKKASKKAQPAKQPARVTKLDLIKKKHKNKADEGEKAPGISKLRDIKTAQLKKDPTAYNVVTHVVSAPAASNTFEQLQAAMQTDIARLKTHKNIADKQALKATLIPNYLPFVEDYMSNGHDYPNSVAVQLMVWLLDTGDVEKAMTLAAYLIDAGNQSLPSNFKCDIPTLLCREMYEWANTQLKDEQSAQPYLGELIALIITNRWDLPIAVESQTFVMAAKHAAARGDYKDCLQLCIDAETVNPAGAGVKTLKAKATKELNKG